MIWAGGKRFQPRATSVCPTSSYLFRNTLVFPTLSATDFRQLDCRLTWRRRPPSSAAARADSSGRSSFTRDLATAKASAIPPLSCAEPLNGLEKILGIGDSGRPAASVATGERGGGGERRSLRVTLYLVAFGLA